MAIRVKKLARELEGSPAQVLALLAELGYDRYTSPMDMVADVPAAKVRKAGRRGLPEVRSAPGPVAPPGPPARPPQPPPAAANDLMSQLVPGVTPARGRGAASLDVPLEALASTPGMPVPDLSDAAEALRAEDARLEKRARTLSTRQSSLEAATQRLEAERDALRAERDALQVERSALQAQLVEANADLAARAAALDAVEAGGVPLARLLEERGLRGSDEQGRALEALARGRLLDPIVQRLRVVDPHPVRRLLAERIALAAGEVEDLDGVAVVQVPEERAEVPGGESLRRLRTRLADELLLSGLLRARLVGADRRGLRLLRAGVDPRIDLHLVPATSRSAAGARSDLDGVDVVILWNVQEDAQAAAVYDGASVPVIRVVAERLTDLPAGLQEGLAAV